MQKGPNRSKQEFAVAAHAEPKVYAIPTRTLHIICPGLRHTAGHELPYTLGMATAAQKAGLAVRIHHPGLQAIPSTAGESRVWPLPADPKGHSLQTRVIRKVREAIRRKTYGEIFKSMRTDDLAFAHTVGFREALFLASAAREKSFALLQRFDHNDDTPAIAALQATAKLATKFGITLLTDSDDLAEDFASLSQQRVHTLPPPLPDQGPHPSLAAATFGFLGAGRVQKGFTHLPEIITAIRHHVPEADFLIQFYTHPDDEKADVIAATRMKLSTMERVRLVEGVQDDGQYAAVLGQCNVVLTPYDRHTYRRVTSRVFVEGLAIGAAVMTTQDTWMAREATRFNLERAFPVDFSQTDEVGRAARAALASIAKPGPNTSAWLGDHSFEQLVAKLLGAVGP